MAASRKPAKKTSAAKRAPAKKKPVAKAAAPKIDVSAVIPKMTVSMELDDRKIKAIQRCIEKGNLTVTFNKIDLAGGKLGDPWLYD